MLGLAASLQRGGASLLTYVKDNLKLYLDFKKSRSDTLAFPSEGSTSFDDSDDYIAVPDNDSLDIGTGNVTVSAWIKPTDLDSNHTILDKRGSNELGINFTVHSSDRFFFQISDGTNDYYDYAGTACTLGQWHHVCAVWNPNTTYAKFYLDGVDVGRQYSTTNANVGNSDNTSELRLGKSSDGYTAYPFGGKMANVAMWTRELSLEEVNSVMNKSYSQLGSVEKTSLVAWWSLDSATVSTTNLIPDSGFDDASEWNAEGDWSVNGTTSSKAVGAGAWEILRTQNVAPLVAGVKYRFTADVRRVSGSSSGNFYFYANNTNSTNITPTTEVATYTADVISSGGGNYPKIRITGTAFTMEVDNFTVYEIDMHKDSHGSNDGSNFGATINSNVYGGNAPVLPRAIDIAESFADAIGNGSAYFNGGTATDKIVVPYNASFAGGTNALTVACWVKNDSTITNWAGFVDLHYSYNFRLGRNSSDSNVMWKIDDETNESSITGGTFKDENWHHIVGTVNGSNMDLYFDGIKVATKTNNSAKVGGGSNQASSDLFIGRNNNWTSEAFGGNIAGVGIWQGSLTQSQVQEVYESTSFQKLPASVKSTLGSELFIDGDMEASGTTGWDDHVNTHDATLSKETSIVNNGSKSLKALREGGAGGVAQAVAGLSTSKLYKLTGYVYSSSGNVAIVYKNDSQLGASPTTLETISTTGEWVSFTHYFVAPATTTYIGIWKATDDTYALLDDWSLKEVTNDLVGYWGLDSTSLGNELTTNGGFDSDTGWTKEAGWTISGGVAVATNAGATYTLYQTASSTIYGDKTYRVTYTITEFTSSTSGMKIRIGGALYGTARTGVGTYTEDVTTVSSIGNQGIGFYSSGGSNTLKIDNVSFKEVNAAPDSTNNNNHGSLI